MKTKRTYKNSQSVKMMSKNKNQEEDVRDSDIKSLKSYKTTRTTKEKSEVARSKYYKQMAVRTQSQKRRCDTPAKNNEKHERQVSGLKRPTMIKSKVMPDFLT